jgi:hypothetical protein
VASLSSQDLLRRLAYLVQRGNLATAWLLAHLGEIEARGLHLGRGYSSLFSYCTEALHLSEQDAYLRIHAARAARRFPLILDLVADGAVHLAGVVVLEPHLRRENHLELLAAARHLGRRAIESLVVRLQPLPPVAASVRKLPGARPVLAEKPPVAAQPPVTNGQAAPRASQALSVEVSPLRPPISAGSVSVPSPGPASASPRAGAPAAPRPPTVTPLSPERYRVQFTATTALREKLLVAQDLMRHQIPDGDPAVIFERALDALLCELAKKKYGATAHPRPSPGCEAGSRHIPSEVKRQVFARDGGRCTFVGPGGKRCEARGFLEFHHRQPFAQGGQATVENLTLRCRAHNAYEAKLEFGPWDAR